MLQIREPRGQVDVRVSDSVLESLNDAVDANTIDVSGFDRIETAADVVTYVSFTSDQGGTDAGMD